VLVLEGELRILLFDDQGRVTDSIELGAAGGGKAVAAHLQARTWYMPVCTTSEVVFFEVKAGPFERDVANRWAPWSPAEDDLAAIAAYRRRLGLTDV